MNTATTQILTDDPHRFTPRAVGGLRIGARDGNRLGTLRQSGASKAFFPRHAGSDLLAVTLNTAGGVTGGDRFDLVADVAAGSALTLTTQTAERIYKAQPGQTARMTAQLTIGAGARIDWLPQETILFDRCSLRRRLDVTMAPDARFLGVETLVLGRALMGERIGTGFLKDDVRVTRDGALVFADAIALTGAVSDRMAAPWCGGPANCIASVTLIAPEAETYLTTLRALMPATGGVSLISCGVLFARLLAADSHAMRKALIPVLTALRGPLPPTWTL
ncbi:urease accessory protein [Loktanella fryxellensis]|uniref:Urease accessory protein UreD n=1 Tax=Loktanella fryxellensis TaxID=245187 RepID=A0A1H8CP24_9RHOB|nr:urease accessory protein UreD [Loktanella fryxellensis]SEM96204.1 urease accessory protein [Loktanella fryxellensis]